MNIMRTFEGRLKNIKLIAFDLDNTLYDETIYFKHSFKIITPYLKNKFNIDPKKSEKSLWEILRKNGKQYPFRRSEGRWPGSGSGPEPGSA